MKEQTNNIKKEKLSHGGKRANSGIKKGTKIKRTLEKEHALKEYRQRVINNTNKLFNAQFINAIGNTFVYEIVVEKSGKRKHVLIEDPDLIAEILDTNNGQSGTVEDKYYIITTAKPDNYAISDMLDRTYGKATSSVELTGKDGDAMTFNLNYIKPNE
jgi:hypothetical protein